MLDGQFLVERVRGFRDDAGDAGDPAVGTVAEPLEGDRVDTDIHPHGVVAPVDQIEQGGSGRVRPLHAADRALGMELKKIIDMQPHVRIRDVVVQHDRNLHGLRNGAVMVHDLGPARNHVIRGDDEQRGGSGALGVFRQRHCLFGRVMMGTH